MDADTAPGRTNGRGEHASSVRASTLSVTGPGSPTPKDPWERYGWLMSAVWLIFLVFPLTSVLSSSIALGWQLFGIVDILAFAVVHTMAFIRVESCPTPDARRTLGVTAFGVLTVLAAVMAPIIGWGALGLTPFLVSFSAFFFRPRTGVILTMTLLVLAGLGVWQAGPELWIFPGILLMVSVSTHMIAALDQRQREHRELRTQMSLTNERDRVARDVHDVLGHSLTVITVKAELAERLVDIDPAQARAELAEIQALSRRSLNEVRATVGGLRAARLEDELRTTHVVLRDAGIDLHVRGEIGEVDPQHRTVLAWVLREAVTNVVRHSRATTCVVTLDRSSLTVTDNGRGMKVSRPGNGIRGLTERVEAVGGRLDLTPAGAGPGTSLTVHL